MEGDHLLEQTARRVEALQSKRSQLLLEVREVERELGEAQAGHNKLLNQRTAISKLPNELLASIFQRCQGLWVMASPKGRGKPFEIVASHVSSYWREVAIGTPLLWNTIELVITCRKNVQENALQRLNTHLTRSSNCLLNISLRVAIHDGAQQFLRPLIPHSERWHHVSIYLSHGAPDDIYAPFSSVSAPSLVHLSLRIGNALEDAGAPRTEYPDTCLPILTHGAPKLSFVRVAGMVVGNVEPPLSTVTTLHVDAWPKNLMSHNQFRALVASVPRLVNLSLTGLNIHLPKNPLADSTPTPIPTLRSLRIRGNATPCHRLLSLLTLPALESLVLSGIDTFDSAILPTLRSIALDSCILTDDDLMNMCRSFPGVTALSIDQSVPDMFTLLMAESPEISPLWPNLEMVSLRELQPADVVPLRLMTMSRLLSNGNLFRRVRLDRRSRTVLRAKEFLETLCELVTVENCDSLDRWPLYLGYDDLDDIFWE